MTASDAMNDVLRAVEHETGKPVFIEPAPELKLHATVSIARGMAPLHVVKYRPDLEPERPYLVTYQCGFILRAMATPPESQFDFAATHQGRSEAEVAVLDHFKQARHSLPLQVAKGLRDQLYNGLMLQLRSIPAGLRVDAWISSTYPALHGMQRSAIVRQLNENAQSLKPELRGFAPKRILNASLGLSAAFAAYFSRFWGDPLLTQPYRTSGVLSTGENLLRLLDETPSDPAHDRDLIDAWGQALQLSGWYDFIPPTT